MMENTCNQPLEICAPVTPPPLTVLNLYQDAETRSLAESIGAHLMKELEEEFDFACTWCGLEDLTDRELAKTATTVAIEADLIIFTVRGGTGSTGTVNAWVESWVGMKEAHDSALVLLVAEDTNKKRTTPFQGFLGEVARRGKMDFLPHLIRMETEAGPSGAGVMEHVPAQAAGALPFKNGA